LKSSARVYHFNSVSTKLIYEIS